MDKQKIEAAASILFKTMLELELTEAEAVAALAMGSTMRLAYNCRTFEELNQKVQKLSEIFKNYAVANLVAFQSAMQAKDAHQHDQ